MGERADDGLWVEDQSQACRPHHPAAEGSLCSIASFVAPHLHAVPSLLLIAMASLPSGMDSPILARLLLHSLFMHITGACCCIQISFDCRRFHCCPLKLPITFKWGSILSIVSLSFCPSIHHVIDSAVQCNAAPPVVGDIAVTPPPPPPVLGTLLRCR